MKNLISCAVRNFGATLDMMQEISLDTNEI